MSLVSILPSGKASSVGRSAFWCLVSALEVALFIESTLVCRGFSSADDPSRLVSGNAERHQDRAPERAGAGLARQHHAVEHRRLVVTGERAGMEGGDRLIQGLGDPAHGRGLDGSPKQGQQNLALLAGAEPEHEAGQDDAVDLGPAPA